MSHVGFLFLLGVVSQAPTPAPIAAAEANLQDDHAKTFGRTKESAAAVEAALRWLVLHQLPDGSWSLKGDGPVARMQYSRGSQTENLEAGTAMALLAFIGDGHTHKAGKYSREIDKGVKVLVKSQDKAGSIFKGKSSDEWMYTHALATKALCELYSATRDPLLRGPCRKALAFCLYAQSPDGGWRYRPQSEGDTSVTGWMVAALYSAKKAELLVPQAALDRVGKYLDRAASGPAAANLKQPLAGSRYAYMAGEDVDNPAMTAEGLLCRMHLGWRRDDPRLAAGIRYLLDEHPPDWKIRDVYYWHHATQAMFHVGGTDWKTWNEKLRDVIVEQQEQAGPERGSWDPLTKGWPNQRDGADTWAMSNAGGRLYVTCFTTYILEIYYQQPLYPEK